MIILDTLLVGGLKFVLGKIAATVEAEMADDTVWREELLAAQMRLELGEIDERQFAKVERELLARIREIRERQQGRAEPPGTFRVTGVEASVVGDDAFDEDRRPGRLPPVRRPAARRRAPILRIHRRERRGGQDHHGGRPRDGRGRRSPQDPRRVDRPGALAG